MAGNPSLSGRTVLVVEDTALVALDLAAIVEALGCTVLGPAGRVAQALRLLDGSLPDAALLNVQLQPGTSAPIAERLRAAGVPYAAVTAYGRPDPADPVWRGVPCLTKPFRLDEVQELVCELLAAA
jgi:CheY-like chemotaxis protein